MRSMSDCGGIPLGFVLASGQWGEITGEQGSGGTPQKDDWDNVDVCDPLIVCVLDDVEVDESVRLWGQESGYPSK